ncbi:MAG: hypothetical protein AAF633_15115 [Chloroflexota bacterium]
MMKLEDIVHSWPPNINRYEQKFAGISMPTLMIAGVGGIGVFVVVSQIWAGLGGMAIGLLCGLIVAGLVVLFTTPMAAFNDMTMPIYFSQRLATRGDRVMEIPMIISSDTSKETVIIENWEGVEEGVIE